MNSQDWIFGFDNQDQIVGSSKNPSFAALFIGHLIIDLVSKGDIGKTDSLAAQFMIQAIQAQQTKSIDEKSEFSKFDTLLDLKSVRTLAAMAWPEMIYNISQFGKNLRPEQRFYALMLLHKIAEKIGQYDTTQMLKQMFEIAQMIGQLDKVAPLVDKQISRLHSSDAYEELSVLFELRALYMRFVREYEEAISNLKNSRVYADQVGNSRRVCHLTYLLVDIYEEIGDWVQCEKEAQYSATEARSGGWQKELCKALLKVGNAQMARNSCEEAYFVYQNALIIAKSIGDLKLECDLSGNLGNTTMGMGETGNAQTYYERALDLSRYQNDITSTLIDLMNLSNCLLKQGCFFNVHKILEEATQLAICVDNEGLKKQVSQTLIDIYINLGLYYKALAIDMKFNSESFPDQEIPNILTISQPSKTASSGKPQMSNDELRLEDEVIEILEAGEIEDAKVHVERFLEKNPTNATAYRLLGYISSQAKDDKKAVEYYQLSLSYNPELQGSHYNIVEAAKRCEQLYKIRPYYEDRIRKEQDNPDLHCALGRIYGYSGKFVEGIKEMKEAIKINPVQVYRRDLCEFLYEAGRSIMEREGAGSKGWFTAWTYFEECAACLEALIVDATTDRGRVSGHLFAGKFLTSMVKSSYWSFPTDDGEISEAECNWMSRAYLHFKKALGESPGLEEAQEGCAQIDLFLKLSGQSKLGVMIARVLESNGFVDDATRLLEYTIRNHPKNAEAYLSLAELLERLNTDTSRIEALLGQAVEFGNSAPRFVGALRRFKEKLSKN